MVELVLVVDRIGLYLLGGVIMSVIGELTGVPTLRGPVSIFDFAFFVVTWPFVTFILCFRRW